LRIWIGTLCLVACGSKSLSPAAARLHEGEESDLTDCQQLERVTGTASNDDKNAQEHAKNQARERAAAIGATHIRWIIPCCTSVEAQAYKCDVPEDDSPL
jgi:hypothetical protein